MQVDDPSVRYVLFRLLSMGMGDVGERRAVGEADDEGSI